MLKRTTSGDTDFQHLVIFLDAEMKIRDGDDHSFYNQFNKIDQIRHVVLYYIDGIPVGCGAFKEFDRETAEIKRMFVQEGFRGKGVAWKILNELESWAAELNYSQCILETGKKMPEAIRLYGKAGYEGIPNYGQYEGVDNSVCMKKIIRNEV